MKTIAFAVMTSTVAACATAYEIAGFVGPMRAASYAVMMMFAVTCLVAMGEK